MKFIKISLLIPILCYGMHQYPVNKHAPKGGQVTLAHIGRPNTLHPHSQSNQILPGVSGLLFETLIIASRPYQYHPLLAKSIIISDKKVTVTLDRAAYFQDGRHINTEDIAYSLAYFIQPQTHYQLQYLAKQTKLQIINDHTFVLSGENTEDVLLLLSLLPIIPKNHCYQDAIGSGPYILNNYNQSQITYTRNRDYWGINHPQSIGRYNFDTLIYQFFPSTLAASQAFSQHQIDFYLERSAIKWQQHQDDEVNTYKTLSHSQQHYTQVLWFNPIPPLDDPVVRQALSAIVLPEYLNEWLYHGHYHTKNKPLQTYDSALQTKLEYAARLLDQQGWIMKQGRRYKNGKELKVSFIVSHHQWMPLLTLLQHHYQRLGVTLDIQQRQTMHYHHQLQNNQYHLAIAPITHDRQCPHNLEKTLIPKYIHTPKSEILLQNHLHKPPPISDMIAKSLQKDLADQHLLLPLWSIDAFRVGHNKALHYYHHDQSFIDIHAWWLE